MAQWAGDKVMLKPRLFGSLILLYVVLYKLWEYSVIIFSAIGGSFGSSENIKVALGYVLISVPGLVLASYIIGGFGLILIRKWSASLVFFAAIIDATLILLGVGLFLYVIMAGTVASVSSLTPLNVLPFLFLLVFPLGIAYVARIQRQVSEIWQRSQQEADDELKASHEEQTRQMLSVWPQKSFWVVIFTGLMLPMVLAMLVIIQELWQGGTFDITGDDLFVFILGTVFFALPYIVFAFIVRAMLQNAWQEGGDKPIKRFFVLTGIFLGMTLFIIPNLYSYFSSGEAVAVLIFAPFVPFIAVLPGVVAGAFVGLIAYYLQRTFKH